MRTVGSKPGGSSRSTRARCSPRGCPPIVAFLLIAALGGGCGGGDSFADLEPPPPGPFSFSSIVYGSTVDGSVPLPGVQVCVIPEGECTQSDANGQYSIAAYPTAVEAGLVFSKPGYLGLVVPFPALPSDLGAQFIDSVIGGPNAFSTLFTDADAEFTIDLLGGTYPPGNTGFVTFSVVDQSRSQPLAGVTVASSAPVAHPPLYFDALGLPDPSLTATSSIGLGFLLNVDAGTTELTFSKPGYACSIQLGVLVGWVGTVDGIVAKTRTPVVANANGNAVVTCCPNDRITPGGVACQEQVP